MLLLHCIMACYWLPYSYSKSSTAKSILNAFDDYGISQVIHSLVFRVTLERRSVRRPNAEYANAKSLPTVPRWGLCFRTRIIMHA